MKSERFKDLADILQKKEQKSLDKNKKITNFAALKKIKIINQIQISELYLVMICIIGD